MNTYNSLIKNSLIIILFAAFFIGTASKTVGQNINEQVTVTAAYEPSVPDANKINIQPSENETEVKLPEMTYSNRPSQMLVTLKPESISAVKLVGEPLKKLYRNYARVGFGTYTTPFVDFYAASLRSKTHSLGLHLKHISSSGEIEGFPTADNSHNLVELYGQRFLTEHTLSGNIGFRRNVVHHYGLDTSAMNEIDDPFLRYFEDDVLKQRFVRINGQVGIRSNYKDESRINHYANFGFSNIQDLFETGETNLGISAGADKQFELLDFTDSQTLGLTADLNFTNYRDSIQKQSSTLISLKPFISTKFEQYSLSAGLNINFVLDSVSKAFLFPFVEGKLNIIEDALVLNAGITGNVKRQSFNEITDINPFVQSVLPLMYTREKFTFYAGLRARAGENIDLSAQIKSSFVENAFFFVNDYSVLPYNRFTLAHDDGKMIQGRFEAQFHIAERLILKAHLILESWSLDSLEHAYHTPSLRFGADAMYQIQNKIILRANIAARGTQQALGMPIVNGFESKTLDGYADISFGVEYRYTKVLSAFINFNNLMNSRYYQWNNYPSYRFNLMGGVAYSF